MVLVKIDKLFSWKIFRVQKLIKRVKMKLILLVSLCCFASVFGEEILYKYLPIERAINHNSKLINRSSRVVGGEDAPRGMFPYMVRIHVNMVWGDYYFCGGALISLTHILSVDHCVPNDNMESIDALLGMTQLHGPDHEVHTVSWVVRRQQVSSPFVDLAMYGLAHPVIIKMTVAPISLPTQSQLYDFFENRDGYITGWGGVTNGWLQYIPIRFVPSTSCGTTRTNMVCSAGRDNFDQNAAGGDSGSPIVLLDGGNHVLAGIVSFGFEGHIGGTHIPQFLGWINQITGIPVVP